MATSQPSQALVKRSPSQDVAVMPPPPLKRIKRPPKVLDEDEYTQTLSDIIARDYFPGLLESQAQHEYLAALDSGNEVWIAEAAQKLREAAAPTTGSKRRSARNTRFNSTPSATPRRVADTPVGYTGSETPMSTAGGPDTATEAPAPQNSREADTAASLSLGAFQAKYTSEDNESFNDLLDKQNQKRREKHAYMWTQDQRIPSARQIAHRAREARLLREREEDNQAARTSGGKDLIPMTSGATDARPAKPDTWNIKKPDNAFMFNASSIDEDRAELKTVQEVKEQLSKAGAKEIVHANTRFPPLQYVDDPGPVPASPSLNTDVIARRELQRTATDTDFEGGETPRVNGYAYVDEDESPAETPMESAGPSYRDLLAGQVGDTTPNPFKINEIRKREELHLRMVEKQARRKREKGRETMKTPLQLDGGAKTPASGNMTPAARKLMQRLGGSTPLRAGSLAGGGGGTGEKGAAGGGVDWTPARTPRRKNVGAAK